MVDYVHATMSAVCPVLDLEIFSVKYNFEQTISLYKHTEQCVRWKHHLYSTLALQFKAHTSLALVEEADSSRRSHTCQHV